MCFRKNLLQFGWERDSCWARIKIGDQLEAIVRVQECDQVGSGRGSVPYVQKVNCVFFQVHTETNYLHYMHCGEFRNVWYYLHVTLH